MQMGRWVDVYTAVDLTSVEGKGGFVYLDCVYVQLNVMFFTLIDPTGKVHSEITNKNGNPNYKYFYSNADQGKK